MAFDINLIDEAYQEGNNLTDILIPFATFFLGFYAERFYRKRDEKRRINQAGERLILEIKLLVSPIEEQKEAL